MNLLNYYNNDEFVAEVWKNKYSDTNEYTPNDMHKRMAKEFARIRYIKDKSKSLDEWEKYFFQLFERFQDIIPQGRVMAGLGKLDTYRSLSNCLRLPPPRDSYSSIMYSDTMLVNSAKRGCGYGLGLSNLRPMQAITKNAAKTSTGVIPFGERYSNSTKEVGQEGRRGACLLDLDISHPDAPYWATVKLDKTKYTGANISFKIWNDFLQAVEDNEDYILKFPCDLKTPLLDENLEYNVLTDYSNIGYVKKVRAKELWDSAIHTVWSDGCPGLQFWNKIVDYDPCSVYKEYEIDGTNACGEQPMTIFDTCRLLTEMLLRIVKNPFTQNAEIDFDLLYKLSYTQLEVGDDLIDLEIEYIQRIIDKVKSDPEPDNEKESEIFLWENVLRIAKDGRRIGCGITALADMLAALGIKYDSDEALNIVDKVMFTKMKAELNATIDLAIKYGSFKGWDKNLEFELDENGLPIKGKNEFYQFLLETYPKEVSRMIIYGRRNINWSTIAPVGTTSIITLGIKYPNVSSGCEPQFGLWYFRNKKAEGINDPYDYIDEVGIKWKQFPVMMGAFKDYIEIKYGIRDFDNLSKEDLQKFYEESPWHNALADNIDWKKRVEMQAILQKYTTSAISSTINLPKDVKEGVISDIYMYSWKKGLKGITVYRDGSKGNVLTKEAITKKDKFGYNDALKRPKELEADYYSIASKGKNYGVIVGLMDGSPYELFAFEDGSFKECKGRVIKVKKGVYKFKGDDFHIDNLELSADSFDERLLTRWVSLLLRHGANPKYIAQQVERSEVSVISFAKVISRILKKYIKDEELSELCTECGGKIIRKEGCLQCESCGYSKC